MKASKLPKNNVSLDAFVQLRAYLKKEFDQQFLSSEPKEFLKYLKDRFDAEQKSDDPLLHFRLFIIVLRILVLEEKYECIGSKETDQYIKLAENLLQVKGITPSSRSEFLSLYADLRNISGQILRRRGDHLSALWETQIATRFTDASQNGLALVLSNRLMRVGRIAEAMALLSEMESSKVFRYEFMRAGISRLQGTRLCGNFQDLAAEGAKLRSGCAIFEKSFVLEIDWLLTTAVFQQQGRPEEILSKIKRGGSHFQPEYVLDGILWILASSHKGLVQELPVVSKLRRNGTLSFGDSELKYGVVDVLQSCYDTEVDLDRRIRNLGESLREYPKLILIEVEMLAWLAAARFLARSRALDLAKTCIERYKQISSSISAGADQDVLKLAKEFTI